VYIVVVRRTNGGLVFDCRVPVSAINERLSEAFFFAMKESKCLRRMWEIARFLWIQGLKERYSKVAS
jgi:hypothetical protein